MPPSVHLVVPTSKLNIIIWRGCSKDDKFCSNRGDQLELNHFLTVNNESGSILDFEKNAIFELVMDSAVVVFSKALDKTFFENWANGLRVIQVFVNFKMAAGGHTVFIKIFSS